MQLHQATCLYSWSLLVFQTKILYGLHLKKSDHFKAPSVVNRCFHYVLFIPLWLQNKRRQQSLSSLCFGWMFISFFSLFSLGLVYSFKDKKTKSRQKQADRKPIRKRESAQRASNLTNTMCAVHFSFVYLTLFVKRQGVVASHSESILFIYPQITSVCQRTSVHQILS